MVAGNSALVTPGFPAGTTAAAVYGCWQCHDSQVKVQQDGQLDPATSPNTGTGRIKPNGPAGYCLACHSRQAVPVEQARNSDNCGKCHR